MGSELGPMEPGNPAWERWKMGLEMPGIHEEALGWNALIDRARASASPGAETGGEVDGCCARVNSCPRDPTKDCHWCPDFVQAGAPGAETVEQRVRALAEEWEREAESRERSALRATQWDRWGMKTVAACERNHAQRLRALLAASSGKTGEPDVEVWARAVEAAAETVEEPADWAPLPYQRRMARSLRRLSPPWMEDRSDGLRDAVSIIAAEESQPAPVSQGTEREEPLGTCCTPVLGHVSEAHPQGPACIGWRPSPASTPARCQHQLKGEADRCRHGLAFGTTCEACLTACPACWDLYANAPSFGPRPASTPEPEKGGRS